ncbi:MAG: elongation factor G [Thermoanaerobaculia bacterium]
MQVESPDKIRNIAIAGHSDTGKTTLASAILYTSGISNRLARTQEGNTVTDFDPEEIARGISIGLAACAAPWKGHKLNLLDCPGYGIFFFETESALRATDAALLCINATAGAQVLSERVWASAERLALPVLIVLTKMDRERATVTAALEGLHKAFGRAVIPLQVPIGAEHDFTGVVDLVARRAIHFAKDGDGKGTTAEVPAHLVDEVEAARSRLVEAVAESNDALLEKFFENGGLSDEELAAGLRRAVATRRLFPLALMGAAHGLGTAALLDVLTSYLPSPLERPAFPATNVGGDPLEVEPTADGPAAALVFKTMSDPFTGKISLLRVVRGNFASDGAAWNPRLEEAERVGQLLTVQGKQGSATPRLVTGDIGGVAKLKGVQTGDTLCDKDRPVRLGWIEATEAAISFAVEPKSKGDEEKIGDALVRLMEEDPTLHAGRDQDTGEFLLSGAGQLHVEIAVAKLKKRFHVDVILHPPKVPYRETIRRKAEGHGRHKKQTGGRGQFADCKIVLEPLPRGGDFEFLDEIFGGAIPQGFRPAVGKGIQEARRRGYLAGFPVVDFRVRLIDGQYHDVDSSEIAFKVAGSLAFKDAMAKAGPTLLEPMMKVEISVDEQFMGDVMSDLSQRRGRPQGMDSKDGHSVVLATVPMSEMLSYAPALNAMTQGKGSFHIEFSHYEEVPAHVQQKIIEEAQKKATAE